MSEFEHGSVGNEKVARFWHGFGYFVSIATAIFSFACASWCYLVAGWMLFIINQAGFAMMAFLTANGFTLCAFIAGVGAYWHRDSRQIHEVKIEVLQS